MCWTENSIPSMPTGTRLDPAGETAAGPAASSAKFFAPVLEQARTADLLSKKHFSVDGPLIGALALLEHYRPKDEDEPSTEMGGSIRLEVLDDAHHRASSAAGRQKAPFSRVVFNSLPGTVPWRVFLLRLIRRASVRPSCFIGSAFGSDRSMARFSHERGIFQRFPEMTSSPCRMCI